MEDWEKLAAAVGKAISFLRSMVSKDTRILILIRNPNGRQFVGSDVLSKEVPDLLRAAALRHETQVSAYSKVLNENGDEIKSHGDA